ncbi:MAG TPA: hypothetical protein VI612_00765 [Candidatus Nanoarchaeia archaeon]|nr:hypothetical protein [Candidatus Nanoarchaeia archaeon]
MAKKDMGMVCAPGQCGPKCIILGLLSAAFAAGGLWLVVGGIMMQMGAVAMTNVFLWYFGGFVLWCIAKMCKMKCCGYCRMM